MSKSSRASTTRGLRCPNLGQALHNGPYFYSEAKQKAPVKAVCANLYDELSGFTNYDGSFRNPRSTYPS